MFALIFQVDPVRDFYKSQYPGHIQLIQKLLCNHSFSEEAVNHTIKDYFGFENFLLKVCDSSFNYY